MEEKKTKVCPRNSILDYNLSWGLIVVYLGYLLGIWFAQQSTKDYIPGGFTGAPYFLVAILIGLVFTFLFYNAGKIIFAHIAGYRVSYVKLLGFLINKSGDKTKVKFDILSIFDLSLQFTPKDDDVKKNPKLIFLGGFIAEFIIVAASLVIFFVLGLNQVKTTRAAVGWTSLFTMLYGFLTPLYEILPFRQDCPTDIFNVLVTSKPEDKIAYNVVCINRKNEHAGKELMPYQFESYDSFYRARVLYVNYLDDLYASRLEKAFNTLEQMHYYSKYLNDTDRYIPNAETVYLRYLVDDVSGADQAYLATKKDDKKSVTNPETLSDYRTAVLVAGFITCDAEKIKEITEKFNKLLATYEQPYSKRVLKEQELFNAALAKIEKSKPELISKDNKAE